MNMENNLTKMERIIKAYGKTVETIGLDMPTKYPAMAFPQSLLPFPKEEIIEALNFCIENTNQDKKMTENLKAVAYVLTLFVEDEEADKRNKPLLEHLKKHKKNE